MHHAFEIADGEQGVELSRTPKGYRLHLDDTQAIDVVLRSETDGALRLSIDGRTIDAVIATRGDEVFIHLDGEVYQLRYRHPLERLAAQHQGGAADGIRAPMPGSVITVAVSVGDSVSRGQTLLMMESMKMETTLVAPRDGVVAAVNFAAGQSFDRDALLLSLEPVIA
ncbi:acetyl-CoA carboxylase biotin carboxyl carrier protein subunit [Nevskia ramosa]|uniref:acetyl-CoA carboxylase biotin carboxyl carrier protein subunit n=1 Tax=Nevskia ramosa TaxID=64002 RepID=UPI00235340FF|nr:biotin/lipoyl-containing protein [Nevskia ramosa]